MNKTLVYHLYISDDFDTNIIYNVHKECLKYYKDIFNRAKFIVALNDLKSESSKEKALKFINYIGFNCEVDISFRKNNELYETDTIKREIIDVNNQNGDFIFFSHIKGVNNFKNIDNISITFESIFRWILVMYFYNLNYVKEVEDIFLGKNFSPEIMYGTLLLVDNNNEKRLFITKHHFSGTFYWFNNQFYKNLISIGRIKEFKPSNRMDSEMFPGYLFDRNIYGGGIRTHNDAAFNLSDYLAIFYKLDNEGWDNVLNILGDKEIYKNFEQEIKTKINYYGENNVI